MEKLYSEEDSQFKWETKKRQKVEEESKTVSVKTPITIEKVDRYKEKEGSWGEREVLIMKEPICSVKSGTLDRIDVDH